MTPMIPSLDAVVQVLAPAFSQPSFATHCQLLLGWILCLGRHRLCRVADCTQPQTLRDHSCRHGLDSTYNFFERSGWTPAGLAYRVALLLLTRLSLSGTITLLVDDTLTHKRGTTVWGMGWFRDAVASTRKRTATASGHNWVVVAVAVIRRETHIPILAKPLLVIAWTLPGRKAQPSSPSRSGAFRRLLRQCQTWFRRRTRRRILVKDGARQPCWASWTNV